MHVSELDVALKPTAELTRTMDEIFGRHAQRAWPPAGGARHRPADLAPHRPHAVGRALADRDQDLRRRPRHAARPGRRAARRSWPRIPGIADLQIEKQVLAPQIKVRVDYDARRALRRAAAAAADRRCRAWSRARSITQIVEGSRRFALVLRLPESARSIEGLSQILIETPNGRVPLVEARDHRRWRRPEPDQPRRRQAAHRVVGQRLRVARCPTIVADIRQVVAETKLPEGYFITLGGQFQAQEEAVAAGRPAVDRLAGADVRGAVQPLQVGGAVGADHGQHSAGAGGRGASGCGCRASRCRWRRWSASSRWPASPCATAS